jgi:hypothetical protein
MRNINPRPLLGALVELSNAARQSIALDIARGLGHLHSNNVLHGGLAARCVELRGVRRKLLDRRGTSAITFETGSEANAECGDHRLGHG